jgi:hypothetical protein
MKRTSALIVVLLAVVFVAVFAMPASAHLHERVGDVEVTVGWSSEPAFSGEPNTVQLFVTEAQADAGEEGGPPVDSRQVKLTVEVIFGDKDATVKLPAQPLTSFAFGEPGEYRSEALVPTRPGTYTFHIAGTIKGKAFDKFYTSGEKGEINGTQYNDIREIASVAFPAKDPDNNQLARAVADAKLVASREAKKAADDAKTARLFGIVGIAVGVIGLGFGLRPRRKKAAS